MRILSWDVGIINLAYCLLNVNGEDWKIEDWGIINLTNRESLKCVSCGKNASCCTEIEGKTVEEQYYPASFLDRVNLLYYMNARKKEIENETKISQNSK